MSLGKVVQSRKCWMFSCSTINFVHATPQCSRPDEDVQQYVYCILLVGTFPEYPRLCSHCAGTKIAHLRGRGSADTVRSETTSSLAVELPSHTYFNSRVWVIREAACVPVDFRLPLHAYSNRAVVHCSQMVPDANGSAQ